MPTNWSMNKQNTMHPHKDILLSDQKELLIHATLWMNNKCFIPSESSQTHKTTDCMIPCIWNSTNNECWGVGGNWWRWSTIEHSGVMNTSHNTTMVSVTSLWKHTELYLTLGMFYWMCITHQWKLCKSIATAYWLMKRCAGFCRLVWSARIILLDPGTFSVWFWEVILQRWAQQAKGLTQAHTICKVQSRNF